MGNASISAELQPIQENQKLLMTDDTCDKYDYLAAVGCGVLGGIIDVFLVGAPSKSILGSWTDKQTDSVVKAFAKQSGWSPRPGKESSVASAIGYLQEKYSVNYDQATTASTSGSVALWTKNHHMKSLAHSPDILGLFFSVLNQFTAMSTFIDNGNLITIQTEAFELQGGNLIAKLFCGVANWFGHLMSDVAGSSGSRGNAGRGAGIVAPFYELFGLCKFGKFRVDKDLQDLATIATRAFQKGYDLRFNLATAIPVIVTDLSIRLIWSLRRHFQYEKPMLECIPSESHSTLRVMLLCGNGTLCVIDGVAAGIRSGGNFLVFFMHLNLAAWFRLIMLVLKEVMIRIGIKDTLQKTIDAFVRINIALRQYLEELEKIDFDLFQKETEKYQEFIVAIECVTSERELNDILNTAYEKLNIEKPWTGSFDAFMQDKSKKLEFK